jgi:TRAP-type mannitol/chloroaromatic compound transport system permease small subunit
MNGLDRWIAVLEGVNITVGRAVRWCALLMLGLQFAIVLLRYVFGISYIFLQEGVIYLHAALFMLGAGYTLVVDQHIRVDILYSRLGPRGRAVVDLLGGVLLLCPSLLLLLVMTWPFVRNSWNVLEGPMSVGGIPASFALKTLIPAFCVLLLIQGVATIIRNVLRLAAEGDAEAAG